jgi:hypothetical protein
MVMFSLKPTQEHTLHLTAMISLSSAASHLIITSKNCMQVICCIPRLRLCSTIVLISTVIEKKIERGLLLLLLTLWRGSHKPVFYEINANNNNNNNNNNNDSNHS